VNICRDDNYIDAKTNSLINLNNMKLVSDEKTTKKWAQLSEICESTSDEMNSQVVHPEVVFLGTSSTSPTLTRNVSSILVKIAPDSSILMDCGEGSLGQFMRFHGVSNYSNELIKLKAIFISHFHADHHLGIFELMSARRKAFELLGIPYEKLFVLLPNNLRLFFDSINKFSDDVSFFDRVVKGYIFIAFLYYFSF
jgi:predicted metal-dependent RNase